MTQNLIKAEPTYVFVTMEKDHRVVCHTFKDAFTAMFNWINDALDNGGLSYQVLETAIWIETTGGTPIFFYDARDLAIEQGILKNGKLV